MGASVQLRAAGTVRPPPRRTPTVIRNGAQTATKSQSKSTSEWSRKAIAPTISAVATARSSPASPRYTRVTPIPAATTDPSASRKPTTPVSLRNCSGTLCGSVTTMLFVRKSRCASSNEPAPLPWPGWSSNARQASFHHCQRLVELTVVNRPGPTVCDGFVGCRVKSRNQPSGFDSATSAITATAAPAARTPSATRPRSRRRLSSSGRSASASEPRYASAPTATAASTKTSANQAPSWTRAEWACASCASPGREKAQTATPSPAPPPSRSTAALSIRGPPSRSHATTAIPATSTPPRE